MMSLFIMTVSREFKLYYRNRSDAIQPALFFILIFSIFSLMFEETTVHGAAIFPSLLWGCLAISLLISEGMIFDSDQKNGVLNDVLLSPRPLLPLLLTKIMSHSVYIGLPLLLLTLFFACIFQVESRFLPKMALTYLMCIPSLSLVTALGAAFTLNLKKGGLLLAILVLPLMFPVIVCGCAATTAIGSGLPFLPYFCLLLALFLILLMIAPLFCVLILRVSGEA